MIYVAHNDVAASSSSLLSSSSLRRPLPNIHPPSHHRHNKILGAVGSFLLLGSNYIASRWRRQGRRRRRRRPIRGVGGGVFFFCEMCGITDNPFCAGIIPRSSSTGSNDDTFRTPPMTKTRKIFPPPSSSPSTSPSSWSSSSPSSPDRRHPYHHRRWLGRWRCLWFLPTLKKMMTMKVKIDYDDGYYNDDRHDVIG